MAVGANVGKSIGHVLGMIEWACGAEAAMQSREHREARKSHAGRDESGTPGKAFAFRDDAEGTYEAKLKEHFPNALTFADSAKHAAVKFVTCGKDGS